MPWNCSGPVGNVLYFKLLRNRSEIAPYQLKTLFIKKLLLNCSEPLENAFHYKNAPKLLWTNRKPFLFPFKTWLKLLSNCPGPVENAIIWFLFRKIGISPEGYFISAFLFSFFLSFFFLLLVGCWHFCCICVVHFCCVSAVFIVLQ